MDFTKVGRYVVDRLGETSTWRGLIIVSASIASFIGKKYELDADQINSIIIVGMFLAGMVGSFLPDKKKDGKNVLEKVTEAVQDVAGKEGDIDGVSKTVKKDSLYAASPAE
jgi:hypothetical protein